MSYKILVRGLQGTILTFSVDKYDIEDGFVVFLDSKLNLVKRFAVQNCEIHEVRDG